MKTYHHGDLPRRLLAEAASMATESGPASISLRELARRAGVSHSAPAHHFGTLKRLLTALAVQGFGDLAHALQQHREKLSEMGVVYVRWALDRPGHYAVMWQPRLLDDDDEPLRSAREELWRLLAGAVESDVDAYAAFAVVHGLASIWLSGALPIAPEPEAMAREVTRRLVFARAEEG